MRWPRLTNKKESLWFAVSLRKALFDFHGLSAHRRVGSRSAGHPLGGSRGSLPGGDRGPHRRRRKEHKLKVTDRWRVLSLCILWLIGLGALGHGFSGLLGFLCLLLRNSGVSNVTLIRHGGTLGLQDISLDRPIELTVDERRQDIDHTTGMQQLSKI